MKRHSFIMSAVALLLFVSLGVAQNLSIQGVARDNTGQSLSDGSYAFSFRLYAAELDRGGEYGEWKLDR